MAHIERIMTTQEVADELGLTQRKVRELIHSGKLPAKKMGRDWVIKASELDKFRMHPF